MNVDLFNNRSSWLTAVIAVVAVVALVAVVAVGVGLWIAAGDVEISAAGWVAMGFGALATIALGVGLMALVFISAREGYDEEAGDQRDDLR